MTTNTAHTGETKRDGGEIDQGDKGREEIKKQLRRTSQRRLRGGDAVLVGRENGRDAT